MIRCTPTTASSPTATPYSEQTRFTDADVDTKFRNFTTGLLADGAIDDALKILDDLAAQPGGVDALVHALSGAAR